jgi:hypothetical protein
MVGQTGSLPGFPERSHQMSQGKAASLPYPRAAIFISSWLIFIVSHASLIATWMTHSVHLIEAVSLRKS